MRKLIWRPRAVSRRALVLIAVLAVGGLFLAERWTTKSRRPLYDQKLQAAQLALKAMNEIKTARLERGYPIDMSVDPTGSGLIGLSSSDVTSIAGNLAAKRTSINPNFAAVVLDMLTELGVKEGDRVAVGASGSFPALNICVYAALATLKADPIIISSGAASQWGANFPDLMWVDMEKVLFDEGMFAFRSCAASLGGYEDRALGMSEIGIRKVRQSIEKNDLVFLNDEVPEGMTEEDAFRQSIETRMDLYRSQAKGFPIRAYINIGGGTVSVGRSLGKRLFRPGINLRPPSGAGTVDGVMPRFAAEGVPVVHLIQVLELAERYAFEIQPRTLPGIGLGDVFEGEDYNKALVSTVLCLLIGSLFTFIRSDVGFRLLKGSSKSGDEGHPEPMV